MPTVKLDLRRLDTGKRAPYNAYEDTRAVGIAERDGARVRANRFKKPMSKPRNIDPKTVFSMCEVLPVYPIGERSRCFETRVIKQENMHKLIGIQAKIFNQWLTRAKIPGAAFCVNTGAKGYPPKAYLADECSAIVTALNRHYIEHLTFRDTDLGLLNSIKTAVELARARNANLIPPCPLP
jgi:hypothetical protein